MKKIIMGLSIVVLLLLLATSVAMANNPDGVDSAVKQRTYCVSTNPQG
jgi:hypothetical protein